MHPHTHRSDRSRHLPRPLKTCWCSDWRKTALFPGNLGRDGNCWISILRVLLWLVSSAAFSGSSWRLSIKPAHLSSSRKKEGWLDRPAVTTKRCMIVCVSVGSSVCLLQKRYSEMAGKKFLYGTHYSAPGYVLYFLVRAGIRGLVPIPSCG